MLPGKRNKRAEDILMSLRNAGIVGQTTVSQAPDCAMDFEILLPSLDAILAVGCHSALAPNQVSPIVEPMRRMAKRGTHPALCVPRLTWSLLDACKEADVAIFDHDGNAFVRLPGLYIERLRPIRQAGMEPASGTVFTAKASRLLRAMLKKYPGDFMRADLARETGLNPGYVSTLTARLIKQQYVSNRSGQLHLDDPERLLDDWLAHYRFDRHRRHAFALSANTYEEGIAKLVTQLQGAGIRYAWTGWSGAQLRASYATPTLYMAYVSEPPKGLKGLFPVGKEGNVLLLVPHEEGVFQFTTATNAGPVVSDAQLYIDLCRMPGRAREQADALRHQCLNFARMSR